MRIHPYGDRVVVQRVEETNPEALILTPDSAKDKPQIGVVLEIGDDMPLDRDGVSRVKQGDLILFSRYAGKEFVLSGEESVTILRFVEIEGKLVETPATGMTEADGVIPNRRRKRGAK